MSDTSVITIRNSANVIDNDSETDVDKMVDKKNRKGKNVYSILNCSLLLKSINSYI